MKLKNGILRPGEVLEVLNDGKIKAAVPGLFSREDKDKLPIIYPFFGLHANTYSHPKVGDEVWVLNLTDNNLQLHWFRKDKYESNNKNLLNEDNIEIICNREYGGGAGWATIYFSDGSGWVISEDGSKIQIRPNGSILLDMGLSGRAIDINTQNISLGSIGESSHPAVYGDELMELLEKLHAMLEAVQKAAQTNPYTTAIAKAMELHLPNIKTLIPEIVSTNVTLE